RAYLRKLSSQAVRQRQRVEVRLRVAAEIPKRQNRQRFLGSACKREVLGGGLAGRRRLRLSWLKLERRLAKQQLADKAARRLPLRKSERRRHSVGHSTGAKPQRNAEPLRVFKHRLHSLITLGRLFRQRVIDDLRQIQRQLVVYLDCRLVRFVKDSVHHVDVGLAGERK